MAVIMEKDNDNAKTIEAIRDECFEELMRIARLYEEAGGDGKKDILEEMIKLQERVEWLNRMLDVCYRKSIYPGKRVRDK